MAGILTQREVSGHDCRDLTPHSLFHTGGNISGVARKTGMYEREVIVYSQVVEHFRHILSQRGKQVRNPGFRKFRSDILSVFEQCNARKRAARTVSPPPPPGRRLNEIVYLQHGILN